LESLGIILSVPAAFLASLAYCRMIALLLGRWPWLRRPLGRASFAVLCAFGIELVLLLAFGPLRCRAAIGPAFFVGHIALFLLTIPALANSVLLRVEARSAWQWRIALLCAVFALLVVDVQYTVTEALFGPDGIGGPYGRQSE